MSGSNYPPGGAGGEDYFNPPPEEEDRVVCPRCEERAGKWVRGFSGDVEQYGGGLMGIDIDTYECTACGCVWDD